LGSYGDVPNAVPSMTCLQVGCKHRWSELLHNKASSRLGEHGTSIHCLGRNSHNITHCIVSSPRINRFCRDMYTKQNHMNDQAPNLEHISSFLAKTPTIMTQLKNMAMIIGSSPETMGARREQCPASSPLPQLVKHVTKGTFVHLQ
jgi:hypothetical protein